ncbi:MAG: hypothetical protein RJB66_1480 [Pseudomonadota bacterium]|jgi:RNA recognition motif-containing protein
MIPLDVLLCSANGPQQLSQEAIMGKKIYVGNLSYNVDDQSLGDLFAQFGQVDSVRVVTDRESGRSKGFAFVEMSTDAEASTAIEKLNGSEFSGRAMNVSEAKPMAPRENNRGGGGGRGGFGGGRSRY